MNEDVFTSLLSGYGSTVMLSKKLHVAAKAHDCKKHFWVATVMYAVRSKNVRTKLPRLTNRYFH